MDHSSEEIRSTLPRRERKIVNEKITSTSTSTLYCTRRLSVYISDFNNQIFVNQFISDHYLHYDHDPHHAHDLREMRCLRNKIHANLFLTFVLDCTFWMATDIMQGRELPTTGLKVLLLLVLVLLVGHFEFELVERTCGICCYLTHRPLPTRGYH